MRVTDGAVYTYHLAAAADPEPTPAPQADRSYGRRYLASLGLPLRPVVGEPGRQATAGLHPCDDETGDPDEADRAADREANRLRVEQGRFAPIRPPSPTSDDDGEQRLGQSGEPVDQPVGEPLPVPTAGAGARPAPAQQRDGEAPLARGAAAGPAAPSAGEPLPPHGVAGDVPRPAPAAEKDADEGWGNWGDGIEVFAMDADDDDDDEEGGEAEKKAEPRDGDDGDMDPLEAIPDSIGQRKGELQPAQGMEDQLNELPRHAPPHEQQGLVASRRRFFETRWPAAGAGSSGSANATAAPAAAPEGHDREGGEEDEEEEGKEEVEGGEEPAPAVWAGGGAQPAAPPADATAAQAAASEAAEDGPAADPASYAAWTRSTLSEVEALFDIHHERLLPRPFVATRRLIAEGPGWRFMRAEIKSMIRDRLERHSWSSWNDALAHTALLEQRAGASTAALGPGGEEQGEEEEEEAADEEDDADGLTACVACGDPIRGAVCGTADQPYHFGCWQTQLESSTSSPSNAPAPLS